MSKIFVDCIRLILHYCEWNEHPWRTQYVRSETRRLISDIRIGNNNRLRCMYKKKKNERKKKRKSGCRLWLRGGRSLCLHLFSFRYYWLLSALLHTVIVTVEVRICRFIRGICIIHEQHNLLQLDSLDTSRIKTWMHYTCIMHSWLVGNSCSCIGQFCVERKIWSFVSLPSLVCN